jgi:hypothetical protein
VPGFDAVAHPPPDAIAAWRIARALAPAPRIRVSPDGGATYPRGCEEDLTAAPPLAPATISVYDHGARTGRVLVADLDVARARKAGELDPIGAVAKQAADIVRIVNELGGRAVVDVSPNGGRHVLVPFARPIPWLELRGLARALARRYSAMDVAPMSGIRGQIRPPGARHKSGGWQRLAMPLDAARTAVERRCGDLVWNGLLDEFAGELAVVDPIKDLADIPAGCEVDVDGHPWLPRPDGRQPLRSDLAVIARKGIKSSGYRDRSEARMAILASAAMRGWKLAEVRAAIANGEWSGFAALYARTREPGRLKRLLAGEWRKAIIDFAGDSPQRNWHTSDSHTPRPQRQAEPVEEDSQARTFGLIRLWATVIDIATADPIRQARWGRQAIAIRQVLLALAQAAMVAGSEVIEFGGRNLALQAALPHRTCARALATLRDEPDPLIDLVSEHHLDRADRYQLCIPEAYMEQARWRRRRAGRIDALHRVWSVLGGVAAFVYQALDSAESAPAADVARDAHISPTATSTALRLLGEYGLAEHGPRGWRRGPANLDDVARESGATALQREREAAYDDQRDTWRRKIATWLAPPSPLPPDPDPPPSIDERLPYLEPPAWLADDPGPPVTAR